MPRSPLAGNGKCVQYDRICQVAYTTAQRDNYYHYSELPCSFESPQNPKESKREVLVVPLVALADHRPEGVLRDCLGHHDDAISSLAPLSGRIFNAWFDIFESCTCIWVPHSAL